jgi:hypothetical protein
MRFDYTNTRVDCCLITENRGSLQMPAEKGEHRFLPRLVLPSAKERANVVMGLPGKRRVSSRLNPGQ